MDCAGAPPPPRECEADSAELRGKPLRLHPSSLHNPISLSHSPLPTFPPFLPSLSPPPLLSLSLSFRVSLSPSLSSSSSPSPSASPLRRRWLLGRRRRRECRPAELPPRASRVRRPRNRARDPLPWPPSQPMPGRWPCGQAQPAGPAAARRTEPACALVRRALAFLSPQAHHRHRENARCGMVR
jgi:hypothetical protein